MSIINKTLQKDIFAHAEREYPNECCGLIVKTETRKKYIPCTNVAEGNKQDEFVISPEEYADAEDMGEILAVVHSHPDAISKPSTRDKAVCSEMGIPWIIVSWPEGDLRVVVPEQFPLIGRPFVHGTRLDCYGLVRDFYKETYDISLGCYDHDRYWWEDENDTSFYEEKHEEQGFYKVTDGSLQVGDLIIMTIRAKKPNHAAIYMGNNRILHHMFGKLSKYEIYGGYWEEHTSFVLRHKDLHEGAK